MATKKKLYNPELARYDIYTEVWLEEKVTVKDEHNLTVLNHYWKDAAGELWGDFDHPMENVHRSFDAYRKRKGYMSPEKIRELRGNLHLSVRTFAKAIGISPSALTQIENNHRIQTKYQDVIFKLISSNPQSFLDNILQGS